MQRRTFLKTLGGALGCLVISSCGSSTDFSTDLSRGGGSPLPGAYRFTPILNSGTTINQGARARNFSVGRFPGPVLLNDVGQVFVHVQEADQSSLLRLQLDLSAQTTQVVSTDLAAFQGMALPGGLTLKELGLASTNDAGQFAFRGVLSNREHGYYFCPTLDQPLRISGPGLEAPQTGGKFGHMWGDFQLLDDGSVLLVGAYGGDGRTSLRPEHGLFHLPDGGQSSRGRLLLSTADLVPGTGDKIGTLGLIDGDGTQATYVQQVWLGRGPVSPKEVPDGVQRSVLISGPVSGASAKLVNVASNIPLAASLRAKVMSGQTKMGARVNVDGVVASVLDTPDGGERFCYDGKVILSSGQLSPLGATITGFSGPVVGPSGLAFGHLFSSDGGSEIFVTNGGAPRTVLSTGTDLGGQPIERIAFGLVRDQVDQHGRIVMLCQFPDSSQAVLLGQPV